MPEASQSDPTPDLVARVVRGEGDAAEDFALRYRTVLLAKAKRRYRYLDAEALVQDAFVYYFQNDFAVLKRFLDRHDANDPAHDDKLERYLWDQLGGIASNQLRSSRRKPVYLVDPLDQAGEVDPRASPEVSTLSQDSAEKLLECLAKEDPKYEIVARMQHTAGMSTDEIADALNLDKRAVYELRQRSKRRVARCRKILGL